MLSQKELKNLLLLKKIHLVPYLPFLSSFIEHFKESPMEERLKEILQVISSEKETPTLPEILRIKKAILEVKYQFMTYSTKDGTGPLTEPSTLDTSVVIESKAKPVEQKSKTTSNVQAHNEDEILKKVVLPKEVVPVEPQTADAKIVKTSVSSAIDKIQKNIPKSTANHEEADQVTMKKPVKLNTLPVCEKPKTRKRPRPQ